jgi:hypothetical protein
MSPTQHGEHARAQHTQHAPHAQHAHPYRSLLAMSVLSFMAMFALMYAMVDVFANAVPNLNQFYMAGLMAAPMVLIELVLMRQMYPDRRANLIVAAVAVALMVLFWWGIRQQLAIGDRQFLKSMIPHHAGAILMCEQARLSDPQVVALCEGIESSQRREIAEMKALLAEQGGR